MKPLSEMPLETARSVRVVLTDIDDTVTTEGRLSRLCLRGDGTFARGGILVVPVTGRPAGWCDHIARMWPVDGRRRRERSVLDSATTCSAQAAAALHDRRATA